MLRFKDRVNAGWLLAQALGEYKNSPQAIIYALPRGGVVLGKVVARELNLPLDILITRKIGHPANEEFAVGAVTENGEPVFDAKQLAELNDDWLQLAVQGQRQEAKRRRERYLIGRTHHSAEDKTGIIVDDGIATGLTMRAAIFELKSDKPAKIVIAVPVAPAKIVGELTILVDELIVLKANSGFLGSVGAYYNSFPQVTDEEVVRLLAAS